MNSKATGNDSTPAAAAGSSASGDGAEQLGVKGPSGAMLETGAVEAASSGALEASLSVSNDAPGCEWLARTVRVIDGLDRADITGKLWIVQRGRLREYRPETPEED